MFDAWEYPEKCKNCGQCDNHDTNHPTTLLDAKTKLCEFCFSEQDEE
jgi:hypothetical protein